MGLGMDRLSDGPTFDISINTNGQRGEGGGSAS